MASFDPQASLRKILLFALCATASAFLLTLTAAAQHPGRVAGARSGGGAHVAAPSSASTARAAIARTRFIGGARGFRFVQTPFFRLRRSGLFLGPLARVSPVTGWSSLGYSPCASVWFGQPVCYTPSPSGFGFENYITLEPAEPPSYLYAPHQRDLVWLFRKDGSVYAVADYWFVDDEVHLRTFAEDGTPSDQVMALDNLDLSRTIAVNTGRGFRIVRRDAPVDQYLLAHPDTNPPALEALPPR